MVGDVDGWPGAAWRAAGYSSDGLWETDRMRPPPNWTLAPRRRGVTA